jgi:hypothetical protein
MGQRRRGAESGLSRRSPAAAGEGGRGLAFRVAVPSGDDACESLQLQDRIDATPRAPMMLQHPSTLMCRKDVPPLTEPPGFWLLQRPCTRRTSTPVSNQFRHSHTEDAELRSTKATSIQIS